MVGVQPLYADIKFDTQSSTFGGGNGGNAGGLVPTGSLSYVHDVSDDLKLGLTAGSYLGLGIKFDDTWAGRYYVQQEDFTFPLVIHDGQVDFFLSRAAEGFGRRGDFQFHFIQGRLVELGQVSAEQALQIGPGK